VYLYMYHLSKMKMSDLYSYVTINLVTESSDNKSVYKYWINITLIFFYLQGKIDALVVEELNKDIVAVVSDYYKFWHWNVFLIMRFVYKILFDLLWLLWHWNKYFFLCEKFLLLERLLFSLVTQGITFVDMFAIQFYVLYFVNFIYVVD